jgi:hypothetical protein
MSSPATPYYPANLQPSTSSLGSYKRYAAAPSIGSRPKFGGANRIYSFAHATGQTEQVQEQFVFAIYPSFGKK